ncbi:hypothetical protein Ahy_B10g104005 [Arachis hypogaea]|uniref:Aminotransferase-like plant mobile domain-containing protein n=1 Tax=Arachis hypogaea TaxID=3818 RepID=A0A444X4I9_ARAHY|nr:hypothetical protein Ahy_B10g104005 [Arachis hypogaea]
MCLFGTTLFSDKSGINVHWKYLPLFREFFQIYKFSWGSACLAHMYRSLYWAFRYDCKDIDGKHMEFRTQWLLMILLQPLLQTMCRQSFIRSFPLPNIFSIAFCLANRIDQIRKILTPNEKGMAFSGNNPLK